VGVYGREEREECRALLTWVKEQAKSVQVGEVDEEETIIEFRWAGSGDW
jgi:hypothetical protein